MPSIIRSICMMLPSIHMTVKHVCPTGRSCERKLCTVHLFAHFVCVVSAELSFLWFSSRATLYAKYSVGTDIRSGSFVHR